MSSRTGQPPYRFGFVMEQTLGHVTHYKNMRAAIDADPSVRASWYPITFPPRGTLETLPPIRGNWSIRASRRTRRMLAAGDIAACDALFFHTQVTTLLSRDVMRRVPSVISLDATPINYDVVGAAYGHQPGGRAVEALKSLLNKRSLRAARAFVTWCDWARQSLIDDYGIEARRISVIPPGVNLDLWTCRVHSNAEGPVRVLFVGADFDRKGGDILVDAAKGLRDRCELHLVTKAAIEPAPGIHVYRDLAPNSDLLKQLYATCDVFALPTRADCFPLVIQEAMAAGLPVVASGVGAIGEAVQEGETGLLVPPDDSRALAAALAALADDPARRRTMGRQGRALAERFFDSAANARRIVNIMTSVSLGMAPLSQRRHTMNQESESINRTHGEIA